MSLDKNDEARDALLRLGRSTSVDGLGASLRVLRRRKRLTLTTVAERAGISKRHLRRLENGKKAPTVRTLVRVADALGLSVSLRLVKR